MDRGQLAPVVDPQRLAWIVEADQLDAAPGGGGGVERLGQVELALGVGGRQAGEIGEHLGRRQDVEAGVDQGDRQLGGKSVRRFDDALEHRDGGGGPGPRGQLSARRGAVGLAGPLAGARFRDHPPQGAGPRQVGDRHRAPPRGASGEQPFEGRGGDQRHVAGKHQQLRRAVDQARGLGQGVAGAALLLLHHPGDVAAAFAGVSRTARVARMAALAGEGGTHALGAVPDDHQQARAAGGARGVQNPAQQRPAGGPVQDLRQGRAHARALAGGEHHGDPGRHLRRSWRLSRLRRSSHRRRLRRSLHLSRLRRRGHQPAARAGRRRRGSSRSRTARDSFSGSCRMRSPSASRSAAASSTPERSIASRSTATGTEPVSA